MTLLVDWQIREEIEKGRLVLGNFDDSLINPSGVDFRLGRHYTKVIPLGNAFWDRSENGRLSIASKETKGGQVSPPHTLLYIDPLDKSTFRDETFEADEYYLFPGESIIVSMYEHLELPHDISAEIKGKSSLARLFVANSAIGGFIDPSWRGTISLEITNGASYIVKLTEKMRIGQLMLFRHEVPNKDYSETGRYRDQAPGSGSKGV